MLNQGKIKFVITSILPPFLLGLCAFLIITGPKILDPQYMGWIEVDNDPLMGYMGWAFFRISQWSFPIGLNPKYGLDVASSIVYSDSVPLLSFIFKPFSKLLPSTFQYFGIWTLVCFILQSWFAWLLVGLFNKEIFFRAFATIIFLFIPIMLDRIGMHAGLVSQYAILAALYLIFKPSNKKQTFNWALLFFTSILIHFYIFFLVALIWFAHLLDCLLLQKKITQKNFYTQFIICILVTTVTMWQAGYFSIPNSSAGDWGYGTWSMNLFSFFNGVGWSYIAPAIPGVSSHANRFQFPGLGVFLLIAFAIPPLFFCSESIKHKIKKNLFLVFTLLLLLIFAVTNYINIGTYSFFIPLPKFLLVYANSLRASDRMFWPILYLIVICSIAIISREYKHTYALLIVIAASLIQLIDTSSGWLPLHKRINSYSYSLMELPLKNQFWDIAAKKYDSIIVITDGNNTQEHNWRIFSRYALANQMDSSAAVFARVDKAKVKFMVDRLRNEPLLTNALYIVSEFELPRYVSKINTKNDFHGLIDGFNVIAPNWNNCIDCTTSTADSTIRVFGPNINTGEIVEFKGEDKKTSSLLISGWSPIAEKWGVWATEQTAKLVIPLPTNKSPKKLKIFLRAFVNNLNPNQAVEVTVNGIFHGTFNYNKFEINVLEIPITKSILISGFIQLDFKFLNSISPKTLNLGPDHRNLSIGLLSILFE